MKIHSLNKYPYDYINSVLTDIIIWQMSNDFFTACHGYANNYSNSKWQEWISKRFRIFYWIMTQFDNFSEQFWSVWTKICSRPASKWPWHENGWQLTTDRWQVVPSIWRELYMGSGPFSSSPGASTDLESVYMLLRNVEKSITPTVILNNIFLKYS